MKKIYCKCGCGNEIMIKEHHGYRGIPKYIRGHNKAQLGIKRSEEFKRKNGELRKGKTYEELFGKQRAMDIKRKMSNSMKGIKRKPFTVEQRLNMSRAHLGINSGSEHYAWSGGKKTINGYTYIYSPNHPNAIYNSKFVSEHRLIMEQVIGRYLKEGEIIYHINKNKKDNSIKNLILFSNYSDYINYRYSEKLSIIGFQKGINHSGWKGGITKKMNRMRTSFKYRQWRKSVLKRDNYKCKITGETKNLRVHHIDGVSNNLNKIFSLNNGITLNKNIHTLFHKEYGFGNNTKEQFKLFQEKFKNG